MTEGSRFNLVGESVASYSNVLLMFGFACAAMAPALLVSRMISPENKKQPNPVKTLPMECGQVPSGAGRTHFMMQYYAYVLMFVIFDVMAIFLYAWGSSLLDLPRTATFTNYCLLRNYVCCNGICTIPIKEERHMVILNTSYNNQGEGLSC